MMPTKKLADAAVARSFVVIAHHGLVTDEEHDGGILDRALDGYGRALSELLGDDWPRGYQDEQLKQRVVDAALELGIMTAQAVEKTVRDDDDSDGMAGYGETVLV